MQTRTTNINAYCICHKYITFLSNDWYYILYTSSGSFTPHLVRFHLVQLNKPTTKKTLSFHLSVTWKTNATSCQWSKQQPWRSFASNIGGFSMFLGEGFHSLGIQEPTPGFTPQSLVCSIWNQMETVGRVKVGKRRKMYPDQKMEGYTV